MTEIGPRDDTKLAAIKLEWWPRSDWNRWPPSSESAHPTLPLDIRSLERRLYTEDY